MRVRTTFVLCLVLSLLACTQPLVLYSDLTEREANEMLALLFTHGIDAEKSKSKKQSANQVSFAVRTNEDAFPKAMMLLQANDLPRIRFDSMGDVFEKTGLVSSALEETARLNYALSAELASTLTSIDGVRVARVHLSLPKKSRLSGEPLASSAAVFIKHRDDVVLDKALIKIKLLVVDSIENLRYEDVTVVFFPEKPLSLPVNVPVTKSPVSPSPGHEAPVLMMQMMSTSTWVIAVFLLGLVTVARYLLAKIRARRN